MTPLSALAENFTPRNTSRKPPTPQVPMDNDLDRSFAWTGPGKIETPHDVIENNIATVGAAYPTGTSKPVAMADVAGASGPAVTGAGGPVVAGTRFLAVAEAYARFEEAEGDPQCADRKVDQKFSTPEDEIVSHLLEHSGVVEWADVSDRFRERSPPESFPAEIRVEGANR